MLGQILTTGFHTTHLLASPAIITILTHFVIFKPISSSRRGLHLIPTFNLFGVVDDVIIVLILLSLVVVVIV